MEKILFSLLIFALLLAGCGDLEESAISSITVSPSTATVGVNQSKNFSINAYDSGGIITSVSPTWGVSNGLGSISASGVFTAGAAAGSEIVTASYGSKSSSATVTITENCWIAGRITGSLDTTGVQGVSVSLRDNSNYTDTTDSGGYYSIASLPAGTYEVYTQENHQIYSSSSEEVTVSSGETKTVNFFLTVKEGIPSLPTTTLPDLFIEL
ncbi:MAG: carboxypeptidase regulatory-like domain-containing protein [bacterium]